MRPSARRVLLDTSVVIAPPTMGLARLGDLVAVSSVSLAELAFGIGATDDPVERQRRRRRSRLITATLEVIPFDLAAAESYGTLANLVRRAGRNPRPRRLDLMIAATAESRGLSLATRNAGDFRHLEDVLHVIGVH